MLSTKVFMALDDYPARSVTVDIIKETFGDYVGTWSANDLVENTSDSNDARRLGF